MSELLTALGLMFVLEGALYALFPEQMRRMILQISALPLAHMRLAGVFFAVFGFLIVATLRGF